MAKANAAADIIIQLKALEKTGETEQAGQLVADNLSSIKSLPHADKLTAGRILTVAGTNDAGAIELLESAKGGFGGGVNPGYEQAANKLLVVLLDRTGDDKKKAEAEKLAKKMGKTVDEIKAQISSNGHAPAAAPAAPAAEITGDSTVTAIGLKPEQAPANPLRSATPTAKPTTPPAANADPEKILGRVAKLYKKNKGQLTPAQAAQALAMLNQLNKAAILTIKDDDAIKQNYLVLMATALVAQNPKDLLAVDFLKQIAENSVIHVTRRSESLAKIADIYRLNSDKQAEKYAREAYALKQDSAAARLALAQVFLAKSNPAKAWLFAKAALRKDPDNAVAKGIVEQTKESAAFASETAEPTPESLVATGAADDLVTDGGFDFSKLGGSTTGDSDGIDIAAGLQRLEGGHHPDDSTFELDEPK